MVPEFLIVGRIAREFILPFSGQPLLDNPGGDALYAAGGLMIWEKEIGLLARVGEDYPRAWLKELEARGIDIQGIRILPQSIDLRSFIAYDEKFLATRGNAVLLFAAARTSVPEEFAWIPEFARNPARCEEARSSCTAPC